MAGDMYISGLTGAFDGGAMVDQIMQIRSIPVQRLQQQKALIQAKLSSLGNLSQGISEFLSLSENLNVDDLFKGKRASVSSRDVLSVSVTDNAPNIQFSVTVNKLSQVEIRVSNGGFANLTDTFSASGTITISYDTGAGVETFNVDYNAGETLEDLVNRINSSQNRVKASVYYDGTVYRLMLSETDVGASTVETDTAGGTFVISVTGLPSELGTDFETLQNAQNAEITIGSGAPVTSPSNTFDNVISGVTITAKAVGSSEVTIEEDYSRVTSFLEDFEKNYNAMVELINELTTSEDSLFRGNYTIGSVKTNMAERLGPLIELGLVEYDGDTGKISIDTQRLNELLNTDPQQVKEAISSLRSSYGAFLETQKNLFKDFEENFNEAIENIDERIRTLAQRLVQEEALLRREFARLEAFIAQANDIRQRLQQFMVSVTQINEGGNNG